MMNLSNANSTTTRVQHLGMQFDRKRKRVRTGFLFALLAVVVVAAIVGVH